jgi:hypothetical protein
VPAVGRELLERLPVEPRAAGAVLAHLFDELCRFAREQGLSASWGALVWRVEGLVLELRPFERDLRPRARARPVGPT